MARGAPSPPDGPDATVIDGVTAWFGAGGRDLPWRRTRDPWAVLVAELMLQQTGVARVVPRYLAFLDRFPAPSACASASVGDVVGAWHGLGYNRRAVDLHRAAVAVVEEHGGRLPLELGPLLALPGVGPYTARAVLAFAGEVAVGVVDVNVARALSRLRGRPATQDDADALAAAAPDPWTWNQAVMELGATTCRPRPRCDACPVVAACRWRGGDGAADDPWVRPRRQSRFEGSDRQGRGRLVAALRGAPVADDDLPATMGWPDDPDRAARVARTLVADGLAVRGGDGLWRLP